MASVALTITVSLTFGITRVARPEAGNKSHVVYTQDTQQQRCRCIICPHQLSRWNLFLTCGECHNVGVANRERLEREGFSQATLVGELGSQAQDAIAKGQDGQVLAQ